MKNFDKIQSMSQPEARKLFKRMSSYRNFPAFTSSDSWMTSQLADHETIVDVGVGNGENAQNLAQLGYSVIGVDVRDDAHIQTSDKVWEFRVGSAESLPIESSSVSVVWANRLIHHLENPVSFYNEAYRVLKPKGKLLITWPQGSDFRCSDPVAAAAIRDFLTSGANNVNPVSLFSLIDILGELGFAFIDSSFHTSRHYGPRPPYQLSEYYASQHAIIAQTLPYEKAKSIEKFMFNLAQGSEWVDISLTSTLFTKP